jgi:class 3 adenylate cyclase
MRCSKCGSDNREGRRFCRSCGAKLGTVCPECGSANEPDESFCGECGKEFVGSAPKATRTPSDTSLRQSKSLPTHEAADGERKTVTALFADLKGSTELMEALDPEEARAIVDPALGIMVEAVRRYEGYVVQSTGDGIFALFGAPAAYEDHPQRAVYAALQMQQELSSHRKRGAALGVRAPELRIGVNTGEVVVRNVETGGRIEYSPIGHTANLASRLQSVAPPGSVVVSDHTYKLIEGYFELQDRGPTAVRGISEPVIVYEVTGLGPLRTHFQLSATRGLTKFVGRERELEQIKRAFEKTRSGRGQLMAVVAEAGTGKSRLLHEFKAALTPPYRILEAYSVSHGKNSPYLPILDLLNVYFGVTDNDDQERRRERVETQLARIGPGLKDIEPYLHSLMRIGDGADPLSQMESRLRRQRTLDAFKRIVIGESLKQPLVVIFEDLHWIDDETQEALNLLVDGIGNARVLLLVNYRPEYRHSWGNRSHYSQLRLDPLEAEDAQALLDALLGESVELGSLKRLIIEETAGNPFFIEELVQALFGEEVLIRDGNTIKVTRPLSQVRIPATVQAILASRIDRLPGSMKELLQTISVLGKDFSLGLVKAVTAFSEDELSRMLSGLQLDEFIYEQTGFTDVAYSFKHALTQEVAYNTLLTERRRALHERAGEAIEDLFSDRLDDRIVDLGLPLFSKY